MKRALSAAVLLFTLSVLAISSCKKEPAPPPVDNPPPDTAEVVLSWEPWSLQLTHGAPIDIVFGNNGRGAVLTDRGIILTTYDNGTTWTLRYDLPQDTAGTCLALSDNRDMLFVGCNNGGYAAYYVMDISKDQPLKIINCTRAKEWTGQNDVTIPFRVNDAAWNGEVVYAAMGKADKRGGALMRITRPEGDDYPSFHRLERNFQVPMYAATVCNTGGAFYVIGGYEWIANNKAGIGAHLLYASGGYEWFPVYDDPEIKCCEPEEICRADGERCLWMYGSLRRVYFSKLHTGQIRRLVRTQLPGDYVGCALDWSGHAWVATEDGLFRSKEIIPQ